MCGAFSKIIRFAVGLLLSLAGIFIGLKALNIDVMSLAFVQNNLLPYMMPVYVVFGVAGVLGLLHLLAGSCTCCSYKDVCSDKNKSCHPCGPK